MSTQISSLGALVVVAFVLAGARLAAAETFAWLEQPLGQRSGAGGIGAVSALANVFPDEPPAVASLGAVVELSAARNESESAQVVVVAGEANRSIRAVVVSDLALEAGDAVIAASHVEVRLVGYTPVTQSSWRGTKKLGLHPDPLLAFRPFVCPAGQARSLWVTVRVPADAAAGLYLGTLTLRGDDGAVTALPVRLRVFNFTLPEAPRFHTSYWTHFSGTYDPQKDAAILDAMIRLFGAYRVSTNLCQPGDVVLYREADGSVTCDWSGMKRRIEQAVASGFRTLNVGPGVQGVWGDQALLQGMAVIDRASGATIARADAPEITPEARAKAYLTPLADWLQEQGLLDRAYLQIADEQMEPSHWSEQHLSAVQVLRRAEPRIALSSVLGIHPMTQDWFDIRSPHLHFYDRATYQMLRDGESMSGQKNFAAQVSASSTGGWGNAAFYKYQPIDAYDGSAYSKWIPAAAPTEAKPQWLRFDFEKPVALDGIAVQPFGRSDAGTDWHLEGSKDGEHFEALTLAAREERGDRGSRRWSFAAGEYRALRLVWTRGERVFVATDEQPLPAPDPMTLGVREVEFLRAGLAGEATLPRGKVRPVRMMWEYNVDADYPGMCVDNDPAEPRHNGWQSWLRNVEGYLNYGGGQWSMIGSKRAMETDVWVLPAPANGGGAIVYPGAEEVLPSLRLARFRDGVDDYDYLMLLSERQPDHPLLRALRQQGREAFRNPEALTANRQAIAAALSE